MPQYYFIRLYSVLSLKTKRERRMVVKNNKRRTDLNK